MLLIRVLVLVQDWVRVWIWDWVWVLRCTLWFGIGGVGVAWGAVSRSIGSGGKLCATLAHNFVTTDQSAV